MGGADPRRKSILMAEYIEARNGCSSNQLKTLIVDKVDVSYLKEQRDALLGAIDAALPMAGQPDMHEHIAHLDGLVLMLDYMLDGGA